MKYSSFSFKLHKNERMEKRVGVLCTTYFMQQSIESSSNLAPISRLCQMSGLSIASKSCHSSESLCSTDWLFFRSSMVFGVYFIKSMLPGHTIWHAEKFEDCLPWVHLLYSASHNFQCVSPTLITKSSTLDSCWLMKDTSMPSFDRFHHVDLNILFEIEI